MALFACAACGGAAQGQAPAAAPTGSAAASGAPAASGMPAAAASGAPEAGGPFEEGDALFKAGKWAEAAGVFEKITAAEPANEKAWSRLGASLHSAGRYEEAVRAWQKAVDLGKAPIAMYNLACALARAGKTDAAFDWLGRAVDARFAGAAGMRADPDLAGLQADPRFAPLAAKAAGLSTPCLSAPEHRQLDFWVGEWDVETPQGQRAGENVVSRESGGCLILESWTGAKGGVGKSMSFYDPARKLWRQVWVGSGGGISEFAGEFRDGAMRFASDPRSLTDPKVVRRLTFFHLGPDRVRQLSERSTDGGATYQTEYDFTYKRRQSKQEGSEPPKKAN